MYYHFVMTEAFLIDHLLKRFSKVEKQRKSKCLSKESLHYYLGITE